MKIFIYETSSVDPYYNLALENALCEYVNFATTCGENLCGLFLWQSEKAVVIGRNQNAMRECDIEVLRRERVKLVRRLTGGGAVYQDLGNLNYSFISSGNETSVEHHLKIVLNTLRKLGVEAVCSGRNDITFQNRKLSGTAQKKYHHAFLLHGTLLVDLDKNMAEKCLTPNQFKLSNKGINSVKSRMVNIRQIIDCSIYDIKECIKREFMTEYAGSEIVTPDIQECDIKKNKHRLISPDWIIEEGLHDFWIVQKKWGTVRFSISENKGCIHSVEYETDCIEVDFMEQFFEGMKGMRLNRKELLQYLTAIKQEKLFQEQCIYMAADLIEKIIDELQ